MGHLSPTATDRQYNARAAIPDHPEIFQRWRDRSAQARDSLRCELDYYYGPSPSETVDIFPSFSAGAPLFVFIHGGYWRSLDKSDFSFLAPAFVDAGVALAVVNYGLSPRTPVEEIVRQMLRACAWAWRNCMAFGVNPQRLYVGGHSAGGHLAAMMLAAQWSAYARDLPDDLVRGALAVSGIYDLEPLVDAPFLREDVPLDRPLARRLSPIHYMPLRKAPLYTAVGGEESEEFKRQNRLIAQAWPHCFAHDVPMPGRNHLTVIEELGNPSSELFSAALALVRGGR